MDVKGKKVFVGLSGGVDSAVTATLLKQAGATVVGVFIKGWYPPGMPCSWSSDRRDAMRVAAKLRIPFRTLDASDEYKRGVIDYLLREYRAGRTPNPDVMCNKDVKFGAFYHYAVSEGADLIATGHYARLASGKLLRGVSDAKDQSYFLWAVSKKVLAHVTFPLGVYEKAEVRRFAKRFNLPVKDKPDSQGICFLGDVSIEDFLRSEFGATEGKAIDADGMLIGMHGGSLLYTLGERVTLTNASPGPWYVIKKDIDANVLTVARKVEIRDTNQTFTLSDSNWLQNPASSRTYEAQYRYHGPRVLVRIKGDSVSLVTPLSEPVASGQSMVIYDGDELIGGGVIS